MGQKKQKYTKLEPKILERRILQTRTLEHKKHRTLDKIELHH